MNDDPRPLRNLYAAITLLGCLLALYWHLNRGTDDLLPMLAGLLSSMVAPVGFVLYLTVAFDAARYRRLKKGKGILVRWTIPTEEWNAHVYAIGPIFGKHMPRTEPAQIVIAQTGILINDTFQPLPHNGFLAVGAPKLVEGPPRCLEFPMAEAGAHDHDSTPFTVKVPIPSTVPAEEVQRVVQYFQEHLAMAKLAAKAAKKRNETSPRLP